MKDLKKRFEFSYGKNVWGLAIGVDLEEKDFVVLLGCFAFSFNFKKYEE